MPTSTEESGDSRPHLSFECFPPRSAEGERAWAAARRELAAFEPEMFSVTYGAGGSTFDGTRDAVRDILADGHRVAPHLSLSAGAAEHERILALLQDYRSMGVRDLVALRGDAPTGGRGPLQRYAEELVRFTREHTGDHFRIAVAAYPERHPDSADMECDLLYLQRKLEAGADLMITQFFFNADAYFYFRDTLQRRGIEQPVRPGIMPLSQPEQLYRFAERCGAEMPRWLRAQLNHRADDAEARAAFGVEFIAGLCQRLLDGGAPGLHFYTLNRAEASAAICRRLGCWGAG